jgi:hypothetical protein
MDHNYTFFGAQYRACNLAPSSFRLPLPVLPVDFANELLAKLYSCGIFANRLLKSGASSVKRLTARSILLSARASPAKRCIAGAMCNHPLDNNIEFHLPFSRVPTIRTLLGTRICLVIFLLLHNRQRDRP